LERLHLKFAKTEILHKKMCLQKYNMSIKAEFYADLNILTKYKRNHQKQVKGRRSLKKSEIKKSQNFEISAFSAFLNSHIASWKKISCLRSY